MKNGLEQRAFNIFKKKTFIIVFIFAYFDLNKKNVIEN